MKQKNNSGAILILSGPSGCGKSSLLKNLFEKIDNYYFSISTTTRQPRENEKNGIDYFFTDIVNFERGIKDNDFLEFAKVHNNYYGTSLKPIYKALEENKLVIFDIDVQGHKLIREKLNNITTSIFITTPTLSELESRLYKRATDDIEIINRRLENAKNEIEYLSEYDYYLVNDNLELASKQLEYIAQTCQLKTTLNDIENIKNIWLNN